MSVTITLEDDAALILFEALAPKALCSTDVPLRNALLSLQGTLEKQLVAPFASNYIELIESARSSLVARLGS